jgi:endonuclease YncB( thermonuclease family)
VTDGDTIKVRFKGRTRSVRLIGIDTPEVYGGVECGGKQASRSMKRMLDPGDRVKLVRDRTQDRKDRYGRLLRYVKRKGRDVGKRQIRKGWAKVYVYERPFKRLRSYRKARRKAQRADRGVWGKCGGDFHK